MHKTLYTLLKYACGLLMELKWFESDVAFCIFAAHLSQVTNISRNWRHAYINAYNFSEIELWSRVLIFIKYLHWSIRGYKEMDTTGPTCMKTMVLNTGNGIGDSNEHFKIAHSWSVSSNMERWLDIILVWIQTTWVSQHVTNIKCYGVSWSAYTARGNIKCTVLLNLSV